MNEMKELLLEILENVFKAPDVTATQQMGVSLSNTIKREGVVIIQNQNVEVLSHIVPLITKGLRLCDEPIVTQEPKQEILQITEAKTPVIDYCRYLYDLNTNWEDMQTFTKDAYLSFVIEKYTTKAAAAKFLGMGSTYLSKLTKEV
jgi:hypothetical protein